MYTAKWFSYTYICIYSFSDSFQLWVITKYWVQFPVLHCRSLLIICFIYSSVYINPKLLIYPSPPFPFGNHKFDFYVSDSISVV